MTTPTTPITDRPPSALARHSLEDADSWRGAEHRYRQGSEPRRRLTRHKHSRPVNAHKLESELEAEYQRDTARQQKLAEDRDRKSKRHHKKLLQALWSDPGINRETVHGLMIDAGSTGSRMHVYEWEPRILETDADVADAVAGTKLSFPGTDSRWTDRLQPGIASFAKLPDDKLKEAVADYLRPLIDFAKAILHEKQQNFEEFPIFFRATAGMRILAPRDRSRVMTAVRELFSNKTYCPFAFTNEQARTLSGEEEAIFDWTGVNFVLGDLLEQSQGAGTVINPKQTVGALDLGGASTQISFYEPDEDIMANLFKLQIGQAKHWNVYSHSFLYYGMNEALNRFQARLVADKTSNQRLVEGIYNPCLPGGAQTQIRSNIHLNAAGLETWNYTEVYPSGNGYYQAILKNDRSRGDFQHCMTLTRDLLHLEKNDWCDFSHNGECSLAGIYQPKLPTQSETVGSFVGFSNYYHIWKFLNLPEYATLNQLYDATEHICSMTHHELVQFTTGRVEYDDIDSFCFRASYAFQLLHNGYGFKMNDTIRATKVINGQKIGWALGAMLYEINTMPWRHAPLPAVSVPSEINSGGSSLASRAWDQMALGFIALCFISLAILTVLRRRRDSITKRLHYELVKEVEVEKV